MSSPALKEVPLPQHTVGGHVVVVEEGGRSSTTKKQRQQQQQQKLLPCSLCPHALAWDSQVYGRTQQGGRTMPDKLHEYADGGDDGSTTTSTLYSWQTSLAPHRVTQIVSNNDGSILAAATNVGTVSLLRGSDGKVLATRQVAKTSTLLSFVPSLQGVDGDTLLIQSQPIRNGDDDDNYNLNCVLVSNIQGTKLNGRPESATEAARQLKIRAIPKQVPGWNDVARVTALSLSESVMLLVAVTDQGKFVRWEWNLEQGTLTARTEVALQFPNSDQDWVVDFRLGLKTQTFGQQNYVVFMAYAPGETALAWLDPYFGQCVSHIPLKIRAGQVGSFIPLASSMSSTLAVAVVTKSDTTKTEIKVYQLVVEDTMGLTVLTKPHLIFSVPVDAHPREVTLSDVLDKDIYAFEFQYPRNGFPVVMDLHPSTSTLAVVGKIRYLLQTGSFDQADAILASIDGEYLDPLASFHPSEVASRRLKSMVSGDKSHKEDVATCLERLAEGASKMNKTAVEEFARACEMIPDGAKEETLDQLIALIDQVLFYVNKAIQLEPALQTSIVKNVQLRLLDRKRALRFVAALPDEIASMKLMHTTSSKDLLGRLLADRQYLLVEKLWQWDEDNEISVDDLLEQVVKLSHNVDPTGYSPILKNVLLPTLSVNHELLPILLAWCCETADGMDETDVGLSGAMALLQVVQDGVRNLREKLYSSFATSSPFVDGIAKALEKPKATAGNSSTRDKNVRLATSTKVSSSTLRTPPTILKLAGLKARAGKRLVRTMGKWSTSQDIEEECVEKKMAAAKCLFQARSLGLSIESIRLRQMGSQYSLEDCILALVSSLSHGMASHEERSLFLQEHVKVLCDETGCCFDGILLTYISGLCKETNVTSSKVREAASVARCCLKKENMASGTLVVVRAGVLCGYSGVWLLEQARQAISWASSDLVLRSDMEEAARLLLIQSIVIKYCGKGARELLRVDNPKHAINLLDYVIRRMESVEQVNDIFHLCDCFLHLGTRNSLLSLMRQSIVQCNSDLSIGVIGFLYERDEDLADRVLIGTLSYIMDLLKDYCSNPDNHNKSRSKEMITNATGIGCELISIAIQNGRALSSDIDADINCFTNGESIVGLYDTFSRIHELQKRHDTFLCFGDLHMSDRLISCTVAALNEALSAFINNDSKGLLTKVKEAERACLLLTGRISCKKEDIWRIASSIVAESLIPNVRAYGFFKFLNALGFLRTNLHDLSCRTLLHLTSSICKNGLDKIDADQDLQNAYDLSLASFIVREHALRMSSCATLVSVVERDAILDVFCNILNMVDDGIGDNVSRFRESFIAATSSPNQSSIGSSGSTSLDIDVYQPSLHPTWYHGDGLLLPASTVSMMKSLLELSQQHVSGSSQEFTELQSLLAEKGCNFLRLRLLNLSLESDFVSPASRINEDWVDDLDFDKTLQSLCERSLGGAGVGMTSGVVDSELSVSFLLALPVKLAFKIYTSTIPIALKTHQYRRLHILASIGTAICEGAAGTIPVHCRPSSWSRQQKLLEQCRTLVLKASWWIRFSDLDIDFDTGKFEVPLENSAENDLLYVTSLIPTCIATLSKMQDPQAVRDIISSFAQDFQIDTSKVLESQLEFVQRPCSLSWEHSDKRRNISYCNAVGSQIVRLLKPLDRSRTLRRCVKTFELHDGPLIDYERFEALLSLYRDALLAILEDEITDPFPVEFELDLVDRRKDALEILMSYFEGPLKSSRPDFLGFFQPFHKIFGKSCGMENKHISILGSEQDRFDPLSPLRSMIYSANNSSLSAALSPLSLALGLPQGYVRARFLIAKFELAAQHNTSLPSFENEVEPVIERLRSPNDQAILAEWAAQQYSSNDERLKCYEVALKAAMQTSSDIEFRRRTTPGLADLETQSLETVRRLTITKSNISDKLRVAAILRSSLTGQGSCLESLFTKLLVYLERDDISSPEDLLDILLREASWLVAQWAIDASKSLSLPQIQELSEVLNRACTTLAEQHSHIDPPRSARLLASSWLFGGNWNLPSKPHEQDETPLFEESSSQLSTLHVEEDNTDTLDFVLDLSDVQKEEPPSSTYTANSKINRQQTSEEESSALKPTSDRENSETDTQLVCLRIAFVLSCTVHKHQGSGENISPNRARTSGPGARKRLVLMSKISSSKEGSNQNDTAKQLGFQLLQVAFAKKTFKIDALNDSLHSAKAGLDGYNTKTITYAMRHRALRAASILCPQEVLEEICSSEGYLRLSLESKDASLSRCCFGSFVAKEIEEMGLQLPHSDLPQLSTMNFPSYARTLWRHSRDASFCPSRGRVLLLLTEMTLKADNVDHEFIGWLLKEMAKLSLPRTKLFALERISESRHVSTCKNAENCGEHLWIVVESTANAVLSEAFATMSSDSTAEDVVAATCNTIRRLNRVMLLLCGAKQEPKLNHFIRIMSQLYTVSKSDLLNDCLQAALQDLQHHQTSLSITLC